jgi:uncharacterized integral membrane protein (TIGR00697 family)
MLDHPKSPILPKYLVLLIMLYLCSIILAYLFSNKEMHFSLLGTAAPGSLILPLAFVLIDIIAEVYGYQIAKQVIWSGLAVQAFFFFLGTLFAYFPDPGTAIANYTPAQDYEGIFSVMPRTFLFASLGYLVGIFVNTYLVSKWKVILRGRYFWLRSVAATTIGEFIFTVIGVSLICVGRFSLGLTLSLIHI